MLTGALTAPDDDLDIDYDSDSGYYPDMDYALGVGEFA
jgi:hypothetical protein